MWVRNRDCGASPENSYLRTKNVNILVQFLFGQLGVWIVNISGTKQLRRRCKLRTLQVQHLIISFCVGLYFGTYTAKDRTRRPPCWALLYAFQFKQTCRLCDIGEAWQKEHSFMSHKCRLASSFIRAFCRAVVVTTGTNQHAIQSLLHIMNADVIAVL